MFASAPRPLKKLIFKKRVGYTKNKGHGVSKVRRQMAKASRRRNRV